MARMGIQERYDDIVRISGLSEEIVRRVFKATRQSIISSLKDGESATIPGICTIKPEIRHRIDIGGTSMTGYIKLKASASTALEAELEKVDKFTSNESEENRLAQEEAGLSRLNIVRPEQSGIITTQISALM